MNYKMMGRLLAWIFSAEAVFMLPAAVISLVCAQMHAAQAFIWVILGEMAVACALFCLSRGARRDFYAKEGLVCVGVSWILLSAVGALPLWLSGALPSFHDALFETVSGFTTTGASVLADVEALPHGILYWRSFTHWIGGMGVLVFLLALVPIGGKNEGFTMHLLRAESPGPDVGKLVPKMRRTAAILYGTYLALSFLNLIFLLCGGLGWLDSLCIMFGTAGTGGFSVLNTGFATYSPYIQNVTTVFMILFGVNFGCYYLLMLRNVWQVVCDEELRLYFVLIAGSTVLITWNTARLYPTLGEALRHAAFQVGSIITTTGFASTDFNLWPTFSRCILVLLMIVGACAGSTGGGFKCARVLLVWKSFTRNIKQVLNPRKIQTIRISGRPVDERSVTNAGAYLCAYCSIFLMSFLLICLDPYANSLTTAGTAVLACLNNVGPGLDGVGPMCNFAGFSVLSKLILTLDMLVGRLEIFPILVLFSPKAWNRV